MPDNKRMLQGHGSGPFTPRVFRRSARGKKSARLLVKCGDCDKSVEIYHDDQELEINGVLASLEDWRAILLPLLQPASA